MIKWPWARFQSIWAAIRSFQSPAQDPFAASLVAMVAGLIVGYAALAFREAIAMVQMLGFGTAEQDMTEFVRALPWWIILTTPILGSLIVALILRLLLAGGPSHAVAEVIQSNMISAGRLRLRDGLTSAFVAATALGTGASAGREGPVIHLGATLASFIAQRLSAPPAMARTILGCGVAAAIAASFNAPLAGVFFALEVVLGSYAIASFAPIVIAAVMGTIVTRIHVGDYPAFILPDYTIQSFWEVPGFLALGVVCALVAALFIHLTSKTDDALTKLPVPRWLNPPIAGLCIGLAALILPEVLSVGYGPTDAALKESYGFFFLLVLLVAKLALTALCLAARFGAGVFSPSLFLGAMTGGAFGIGVDFLFIPATTSPGLYAIVGMGAVAGAVLGAPISTVLIVFELTGDYQLTLALMAATAMASVVTHRFFGHSYFQMQFKRRGLEIDEGEARILLRQRKVSNDMDQDFLIVPEDATLTRVRAMLARLTRGALIVVRQSGSFAGIIRPRDMTEDVGDDALDCLIRAADLARPVKGTLLANDSLKQALSLMTLHNEDMLPVLDDLESRTVKGVMHKTDILMIYNQLLLDEKRHQHGQ